MRLCEVALQRLSNCLIKILLDRRRGSRNAGLDLLKNLHLNERHRLLRLLHFLGLSELFLNQDDLGNCLISELMVTYCCILRFVNDAPPIFVNNCESKVIKSISNYGLVLLISVHNLWGFSDFNHLLYDTFSLTLHHSRFERVLTGVGWQ